MDILYIKELKLVTKIGPAAWEQEFKQTLLLDIELKIDAKKIARSDDLKDTSYYVAIVNEITERFTNHQCELLETLAERITMMLFESFKLDWLRLQVRKPGAMTDVKEVGVIVERGKR